MPETEALRVYGLIPVKALERAKSRWRDVPDPDRRAALLAMVSRVVHAAAGALGQDGCTIITDDRTIQRVAEQLGVAWMPDPGEDLNSTIWLAMQDAFERGAGGALYLPADVAAATSADVQAVVEASEGCTRPVAVPAERDGGTNALLMPAMAAFPPSLGLDSFERHRRAAEALGMSLDVVRAPGLIMDVDTSDAFAWVRDNLAGFEDELSTWRRWLDEGNL